MAALRFSNRQKLQGGHIGPPLRRPHAPSGAASGFATCVTPRGVSPPSPNGAANQKAGLSWTCLIYRHTFGSQLAMKGESLYKITTLMCNSPEICRRHYAALVSETLGEAVEFQPLAKSQLALSAG